MEYFNTPDKQRQVRKLLQQLGYSFGGSNSMSSGSDRIRSLEKDVSDDDSELSMGLEFEKGLEDIGEASSKTLYSKLDWKRLDDILKQDPFFSKLNKHDIYNDIVKNFPLHIPTVEFYLTGIEGEMNFHETQTTIHNSKNDLLNISLLNRNVPNYDPLLNDVQQTMKNTEKMSLDSAMMLCLSYGFNKTLLSYLTAAMHYS